MKKTFVQVPLYCGFLLLVSLSCHDKSNTFTGTTSLLNLKRGDVIVCGPADKQFGKVGFEMSCAKSVQKEFDLAIALLHSFEYDEAEKVFAKVVDAAPDCAMGYWGIAMSNYHPLWAPPTQPELEKGAKAIAIAQSLKQKSKRESDYIEAIALFYNDWDKTDHRSRSIRFEKAMAEIHANRPDDKEAAVFYALSLIAAADPADKSFAKQKQAGAILTSLYPGEPNHPGIVHYIIHAYDVPELAELGLPSARKYASVAPSSAHALHMPSHIFTRLGLWDECISSNLASVSSAQCYAQEAGIKGHWDEELHGLDYLVYGYLQKGDNERAKKQYDYLDTIREIHPVNFKVAYALASIPSRYVLERKAWNEAANLKVNEANVPWNDYPWQKAIVHFTRLLGSVHTDKIDSAKVELQNLHAMHNKLMAEKDSYKADQVTIQIKTGEAWIRFKEGKIAEAQTLMYAAADMEDKTGKHPVTPGEVLPARELLGDLLLAMNEPKKALEAYETSLKKNPGRLNGLRGALLAAKASGDSEKAAYYYRLLPGAATVAANLSEPAAVSFVLAK